jgi:Helicase conserved C-terminal domain
MNVGKYHVTQLQWQWGRVRGQAAANRILRPKIIASTATVRRAEAQIHALFERNHVAIFPPPGHDRRNSFFALTEPSTTTPARLYVGVAAQGRSLKVVLLRAGLALLSAGQTAYQREGGKANKQNPADPYMTLLGYFNSLRELGGSRRIVEDEVRTRVQQYSRRKRRDPADNLFSARNITYEVLELTSRVSTGDVATAKRRLALPFHEDERVDVALATNMISVGLDIIRLGLMVVLGQPKTSAEYIQATSRVGRDPNRPGLVVTLLNVHKPRDRSHYERFEMYHATFYRAIEATSVTPFSPRALDRALPAALVALCRQGMPALTPPLGATGILTFRAMLDRFATRFADRARNHDPSLTPAAAQELSDKVLHRCGRLLDDWRNIAAEFQQTNTKLQYQQEVGAAQCLLYPFLHPDLPNLPPVRRKFRASRSMRDVEPNVDLGVKNLNDWTQKP